MGPIDNKPALLALPFRYEAIIWTNYGFDYYRIYASLGRNELMISGMWFQDFLARVVLWVNK